MLNMLVDPFYFELFKRSKNLFEIRESLVKKCSRDLNIDLELLNLTTVISELFVKNMFHQILGKFVCAKNGKKF